MELIKKDEITEFQQKELDKQLIFYGRIKDVQIQVISEIVHEALRRTENLEVECEEELIALIDFFSERGVEGHKVITISDNLPKTRCLKEFLNAYCSGNRYLMATLRYSIMN